MKCPSCHAIIEGRPAFCASCGAPLPLEPLPDPLIGRTLHGKYKIVSLLGEGGMGAVYAGEQALGPTVRKVAIKTLHRHLSRDEKIRERFHREVGTLASLEHPNTVQVFDFGTTEDGILFIVMEFVQGQSLAAEIEKSGPISSVRARKIVAQICGSLAEAHGKGIIHRDLKPDNIVLTERAGQRDFVKVLDFGIAKRSGEEDRNEAKLTQQGTVVGTPPYMSPEQFTGQPLDARSDIYSLGIVAYELLTGQLPFEAKSPWEWATLHMTASPKPLEATPNGDALPLAMRHTIMRALAKSKDQRFATISDFEVAFVSESASADAAPVVGGGAVPTTDMPATVGPFGKAAAGDAQAPPGGDAVKGKTQIGEVVVPPGDYGPPPGAYGAPPAPYAPAVAASAPYDAGRYGAAPAVHAAPARPRKSGGKRGLLIGIAAVGAIVSVLAIAAGMGAFDSRQPAAVVPLDLGTPSTAPVTSSEEVTTATATPDDFDTTTPLATPTTTPLDQPKATPPATPPPKATPPKTPTPTPPTPVPQTPTPTPTTPVPQTPTPTPPTPVPQTPTPTPQAPVPMPPMATEPAACISARTARAQGKAATIISALESKCRAAGGTP